MFVDGHARLEPNTAVSVILEIRQGIRWHVVQEFGQLMI